jgi:hypothetical protein
MTGVIAAAMKSPSYRTAPRDDDQVIIRVMGRFCGIEALRPKRT